MNERRWISREQREREERREGKRRGRENKMTIPQTGELIEVATLQH
jgi:hypothetical protein